MTTTSSQALPGVDNECNYLSTIPVDHHQDQQLLFCNGLVQILQIQFVMGNNCFDFFSLVQITKRLVLHLFSSF